MSCLPTSVWNPAAFYLHGYGITGDMLTESMQQIASAARRIIEQIGGPVKDEEGAEDAPAAPQIFAEAA